MDWATLESGLRIGGHRGAAAVAPENTLASFVRAISDGVDYLELDVRRTADEQLVVFHDDTLERTGRRAGRVEDMTLTELDDLDVGRWFGPAFAGERIPTLAAVLALVESRPAVGAAVEAKGAGTGAAIAAAIAASPARARLSICSFEGRELVGAATVAPEIPRILIVDRDQPQVDLARTASQVDATGVNVPLEWCTERVVESLHDHGLFVAAGTIDTAPGIAAAIALRVDACDSNEPETAVAARRDAARHARGSCRG